MVKLSVVCSSRRLPVRCVVIFLSTMVLSGPFLLMVSMDNYWSLQATHLRLINNHQPVLGGHRKFIAHGRRWAQKTDETKRKDGKVHDVIPGNYSSVHRGRLNVNHIMTTTTTPLPLVLATDDIVFLPDQQLQRLFLQRLEDLPYKSERLRGKNRCSRWQKGLGLGPFCPPLPCNASFLPPEERLQHMLSNQYPIEEQYKAVINSLTDQSGYTDIVFITAASADHYEEALGVLHGLQNLIFPRLRQEANYTFKFLFYDLGLSRPQLMKMKRYGNCTAIIPVPLDKLPSQIFGNLRTCAWKPLLMMANTHKSRVTIWMDSSTRFKSDNIHHIIDHVLRHGIFVSSTGWMMAEHLAEVTLKYFHMAPCLMSRFDEMAGGFLAFHNHRLIRQAVLGPWVSCAFSPQCLCPGENCYDRLKPCPKGRDVGPYSRCHRFDQAVLGLIVVNLFDWKATSFYGTKIFWFERDKFKMPFPEMKLEQ